MGTPITQAQFDAGTGFSDGEALTVTMLNGTSYNVLWDGATNTGSEITYNPIPIQKFRERFSIPILTQLDKLEDNIDNDAIMLEVCVNLTTETLEPYRSYLRTTMKTLYNAENGLVDLTASQTIDGMNFLLDIGAIDQVSRDNILDVTTLGL